MALPIEREEGGRRGGDQLELKQRSFFDSTHLYGTSSTFLPTNTVFSFVLIEI